MYTTSPIGITTFQMDFVVSAVAWLVATCCYMGCICSTCLLLKMAVASAVAWLVASAVTLDVHVALTGAEMSAVKLLAV